MRLSRDSAYGVFTVVHLATHRDDIPIAGDDLTESCGIPAESLAVILPKLVDAKILRREPGPPERFALTRPPGEIKLLQIVEAIDGQQEPELMLPRDVGPTETCAASDARLATGPPAGTGAPAGTGQPAGIDLPALKAVSSIAASLLATHTVADLIDSDGGSAS